MSSATPAAPISASCAVTSCCTCTPCRSPQYGAPGWAHCAACCAASGIEEYDPQCPKAEHRKLAALQFPPAHRMLPGSHERPGAAECVCGAPWSRWDDRCERSQP